MPEKYQEPPKFSGAPGEDFEAFLKAWKWTAKNNSWPTKTWRERIALSFQGDAKTIHDTTFDDSELSFETLIDKMKSAFLNNKDIQDVANEVRSLKQTNHETVSVCCKIVAIIEEKSTIS